MRAVLRRRLAGRSHSRAIERPFAGREGTASGDSPFFAPPGSGFRSVSYTHLDVYKRQVQERVRASAGVDLEPEVRMWGFEE